MEGQIQRDMSRSKTKTLASGGIHTEFPIGGNMRKITVFFISLMLLWGALSLFSPTRSVPDVLSIKERAVAIDRITKMRLDTLLPLIMEKAGFDMWIIVCNEDDLDPVFNTMIPYDIWCPITQMLVFYQPAPGAEVERMNISRTNMPNFHRSVWDYQAWDSEKKESQWDCLARIVKSRNPKKIGINVSDTIWASDGLSVSLKENLIKALGPSLASRLESAEKMATLWLETLLPEELDIYERVVAVAHALIAETFSDKVITPGVTTTEDLLYHYLQRVADLGLQRFAWPWFRVRARDPEVSKKFGKDDTVIRRGDLLQCDAGIRYLRYYTDHAEWAYVLRPSETDVPDGFKKVMAEANRLQDVFCAEFKEGLSGNQLLGRILESAKNKGICNPKIYSHSIGYFLHEPGPLIGLPWEQENTGSRGEVGVVLNSTFTAELSVSCPVAAWGGKELRMSLEEVVAFTSRGTYFLDGRQTSFYIIN
jgi:hypothetical protein